MLAMTTKSNVGTGESLTEEEGKSSTESFSSAGRDPTMPVPSGLSALIQAATSQLGILAEVSSSEPKLGSGRVISMTHSEDSASCNSTEKTDAPPARTPTIVPEPDPRKQSFPELLMTLALDASNIDVITFLPDDKFFAIRTKEFSEDLMSHYFSVGTFVEFLDLSYDWGFTRIEKDDETCSGIEVFRHPCFIKGDWDKCTHIKFGETPTDARLSALPERAKIEYSISDDSVNSTAHSKRRLSPGFLSRRESETSASSQKQKIGTSGLISKSNWARTDSTATADTNNFLPTSFTNVSRTDDLRSIALSITTEKLNIKGDVKQNAEEAPLIDRAVESVTQTLVTDAIETLLKDERHTKETYLKHEKELSRSSLPGVVPISTQLFSPPRGSESNSSVPAPTEERLPALSLPDAGKEAGRGSLTPTAKAGKKPGCGSSTPTYSM